MAITLLTPVSSPQDIEAHRATLIVTTLLVVLSSVLGYGALTKPLMELLLSDPDRTLGEHINAIRQVRPLSLSAL